MKWRVPIEAVAQSGFRTSSLVREVVPEGCAPDASDGDTAFVLFSTVLVLGMSGALALFEAGMLRSKNTLSIVVQVFSGIVVLSAMWVFFGYSLVFGTDNGGFIGNLAHAFFIDVDYAKCSPHAPYVPHAVFAMFQMMFAAITPLLITGAFAERIKFKAYMWFIVLWEIIVYYPLAHWIWGDGFLGKWGVLDFAGGIVIHTSAGIASLVSAMYLGRRHGFFHFMGEYPPHNLPLAAVGAALLWIGWFGFNAGSALQAGPVAVSALVSTQIGCSMSAVTWLILSAYYGKPSSTALMNGALAGLAGITPASGFIGTPATIVTGILLGLASFMGVQTLKHRFHIDDALDVSMVHGLTGVIGSLVIGFASDKSINPNGDNGVFFGGGLLLLKQIVAVLLTMVYAGAFTYIILLFIDTKIMKKDGGIRLTKAEEKIGADWSDHSEVAYHKLHVLDDEVLNEKEGEDSDDESDQAHQHNQDKRQQQRQHEEDRMSVEQRNGIEDIQATERSKHHHSSSSPHVVVPVNSINSMKTPLISQSPTLRSTHAVPTSATYKQHSHS